MCALGSPTAHGGNFLKLHFGVSALFLLQILPRLPSPSLSILSDTI